MSGGREGGLLFSLLKQVYNQLKKLAFPSELSHRVTRQLTRASAAARANTRGSTSAAEKLKRPQRNATCQVNGKNATTLTYFNQNKKTKIKLHTGHSVLCVICVIYIYIHLTHVSSVPACCLPHNQSPVIHKLVWKNLREASVVLKFEVCIEAFYYYNFNWTRTNGCFAAGLGPADSRGELPGVPVALLKAAD